MERNPNFIITFFRDPSTRDSAGRTLDDILNYNNQSLEYNHDYIQLLFPLPEPSPFNPGAPLITPEVRAAFLASTELRERLVQALERMLVLYGFELNADYKHVELTSLTAPPADDDSRGPLINPGEKFSRRARASWLTGMDHNHLRLTRIIRSLRVLGLEALGVDLWRALTETDEGRRVSGRTRIFWKRAAVRELYLPPSEGDENAEGVKWLKEEVERARERDGSADGGTGQLGGMELNRSEHGVGMDSQGCSELFKDNKGVGESNIEKGGANGQET